MELSVFRISLDVHRQTTQTHLAVRKADTARKIVAALSNSGCPYLIREGCYAVFKAKKPDGNVLYNECAIMNNCIVYEFTEQTAASVGYMACEFQLYGPDGRIITSPKFAIIISGLVYDDNEVESSGEFTALTQAMADLAELRKNGLRGEKGYSAYEVAVSMGFDGTEAEWLKSLQGPEGPVGPQGPQGESSTLRITVQEHNGQWSADETMEAILIATNSGRDVCCAVDTSEERLLIPLVKMTVDTLYFGAVCDGAEWLVTIGPNGVHVETKESQSAPVGQEIILADRTSGEVYALFVEDAHLHIEPGGNGTAAHDSVTLIDRTDGGKYVIYVSDGHTMIESEA